MGTVRLGEIAYARSGDKGSGATLGLFAYTPEGYTVLEERATAEALEAWFKPMGCEGVQRFELPKLHALSFVLPRILAGGGSRSLRIDAQGKAIGQVALEMEIDVPDDLLDKCRKPS